MNELIIDEQNIQNKIYTIRGVQVMIDRDLAELYDVETRRLNEQVKRNIDRFPDDFMFQLSKEEFENWKSQFINDLIKSAKNDIKLLDNYIDETVLTLFSKVPDIKVIIYTKTISKQLKLDLERYNSQYNNIEIKKFDNSHDRFLIIDENKVYHIGASLKDLGKKWFGFSRMDIGSCPRSQAPAWECIYH